MSLRSFFRTFAVAFGAVAFFSTAAFANTTVRAAAGSGVYASDIYWFDWSGYTLQTSGTSQNFSFSLRDGSTVTLTLTRGGASGATAAATTVPTFGGAAMGNVGYTGLNTSNVALYSTGNIGSDLQYTLSNITLKNPAGVTVPNFEIIMADAESMDSGDNGSGNAGITFVTNGGNWQELERVPATGRTAVTLTGVGTQTVVQPWGNSPVPAWILSTASTGAGFTVSADMVSSAKQGVMLGIRLGAVSLDKNIVGRSDPSDQFVYTIHNGVGTAVGGGACTATQPGGVGDCTTSGSTTGSQGPISTAAASGNQLTLIETMAAGSASTLNNYVKTIQCMNANTGSATVLPGNGMSVPYDAANPPTIDITDASDQIACTITNAVSADMAASITLPPSAAAGSTVSGSFSCTNNGVSAATSATCDVAGLPAGASVNCVPSVPTASPLAPGGVIACTVSFTAPASGSVTAVTTTGSSTPDPDILNNTASATVTINPVADMSATVNIPTNATAGSTVTGSYACTNNGPSQATSATCDISGLPAGATVSCTPTTPTAAPLGVGAMINCSVSFTAPPTGTVSGTATAGSATPDPNTANNTAPYSLSVNASADMVAATNFPSTAAAGSTVSGSFTCTNNGPSPATSATCDISGLPAGATIACSPSVPTASPLAVGSSITCSASYTAPTTATTISGTATAGSSTPDPNAANNTAPYSTQINAAADMTASAQFPPQATPGSTVTGTFTCTNNGPSDANAATCSITGLPAGANVQCTPSVPTAAPLPAGSSITCTATYTAPRNGKVTATITTGSSTPDPNPANNVAPATTAVTIGAISATPVNGWWALFTMIGLMLGGAAFRFRNAR